MPTLRLRRTKKEPEKSGGDGGTTNTSEQDVANNSTIPPRRRPVPVVSAPPLEQQQPQQRKVLTRRQTAQHSSSKEVVVEETTQPPAGGGRGERARQATRTSKAKPTASTTTAAAVSNPPLPLPQSKPKPQQSSSRAATSSATTSQSQNANDNIQLNVSPATAKEISKKKPVVRLHRYVNQQQQQQQQQQTNSNNGVQHQEQEPTTTSTNNRQQQQQRRKKRQRVEPEEEEEEVNEEPAVAVVATTTSTTRNILLPDRSLFPTSTDQHIVQTQKLRELKTSIVEVFGLIFNQIQDDEDALVPCYESVERVYEYFDTIDSSGWGEEDARLFGIKYRGTCVTALWGFGAVVWKVNSGRGASQNLYAERVAKFLEYCLVHLGWKVERSRRSKQRKDSLLREWKDSRYYPACYYAVKLFYKYHSDACTTSRVAQLTILLKFLENASRTGNLEYIQLVWETVGKCVLIRVKDKSATCRLLSLKILSYFVVLEDAHAACQKELKYYTRYDPYDEVRKIGTRILGDKTRIKLRFFFDQAFDKRESVRVEAYRAMGVEVVEEDDEEDEEEGVEGGGEVVGVGVENGNDNMEVEQDNRVEGSNDNNDGGGGGEDQDGNGDDNGGEPGRNGRVVERQKKLVRDMKDLQSDKLCKAIVWGAMHSGAKCNEIVKSEILPKWLKLSCRSNLVQFLLNIDAYQHMKAVVKILDMLLTTQDQERFVESLDLSFIAEIKNYALNRNYKPLTIESFVAWLGLCKASDVVQSIRGRIIPPAHEMLEMIEALHSCVFAEHEEAKETDRNEDITPVFCLVIALEIAKRFVPFEEGTRRHLVRVLERILLDPLLDERVIVIQAINTLHSFVEESQFEDSMMGIFQEVFDAKAGYNRSHTTTTTFHQTSHSNNTTGTPTPQHHASVISGVTQSSNDHSTTTPQRTLTRTPPPEEEPPAPPLKTAYELTQMRSELCTLAMQRLKLQSRKDELVANKQFIDAVPVNKEILRIQGLEAELASNLKECEDLVKRADELKRRREQLQEESEEPGGGNNSSSSNVGVVGHQHHHRRKSFINGSVGGGLGAGSSSSSGQERSMNVFAGGNEEGERGGGEEDIVSGVVSNNEEIVGGGIISTVEEGLVKGLLMVNAFLDLCPKMGPFVRTIYDGYVAGFMAESDVNLKVSVMQFLARIAMIEKREVRKVLCFMFRVLLHDAEVELKNVSFQCIVDLVLSYEYSDFCMKEEERHEVDELHPYKADMTRYLRDLLPQQQTHQTDYANCTPELMEKLIIETLTKKFPPALDSMNPTDRNIANMSKNVGLLKLIVRGRLRDPVIISKILCLWVNQDYSGTPVLRDLEHVLKLYNTFNWWDPSISVGIQEIEGEVTEETFTPNSMMRILGIAVGEGVVSLCQEPRIQGKEGDETLAKFISYFVGFLDVADQPLMRTIVSTILNPVLNNPTRSYNSTLARYASKIPITSPVSASNIVSLISDIFHRMKEYPVTASVSTLRKELSSFLSKLKRVFGDNIAVIRMEDGRERVVGVDILEGDSSNDDDEDSDERDDDVDLDDQVDDGDGGGVVVGNGRSMGRSRTRKENEDDEEQIGRVASFNDSDEDDDDGNE